MKTIIILLTFVFMAASLNAQTEIERVLSGIESNNSTLKALAAKVKADKLENKGDVVLENPEVGYNYLWGKPETIGNRQDISVSQSFDFATITGLKGRVANKKNNLVDLKYKTDRIAILLEAKKYCMDLIYCNAMIKELEVRIDNAKRIVEAQEKGFKNGETNILQYNNAKLNLATANGEMSKLTTERNENLAQLTRLNGGNAIDFTLSEFPVIQLPTDMEDWIKTNQTNSPDLLYSKEEIEVGKSQLTLDRTMSLPSISAGYMQEKTEGEKFRGLSIGLSIPLWSNKNKIRQAKSAVKTAELNYADAWIQYKSQAQMAYNRTKGLAESAKTFREALNVANNTTLLKKALDAGQISIMEYLLGVSLYYDTVSNALQAECAYQKAFAELMSFNL